MEQNEGTFLHTSPSTTHLARCVLVAFLFAFISARIIVFLIMTGIIPDLYLHIFGTHVHHLNYGIFLLSGVGGYLVFGRPTGIGINIAAALYGIGMGLTFDEFGMWLHLGGSYWQRASWDAVTILLAIFALIAFAPSLKRFRPYHWYTAVLLALALIVFAFLFVKSFRYAGKKIQPKLMNIEATAPS